MRTYLIFLALIIVTSCQNTPNATQEASTTASNLLASAEKAYTDNPDTKTASAYLGELVKKINNEGTSKAEIVALSKKGYDVAKSSNIASRQRGFLFALLKEDFNNQATPARILDMANQMKAIKRAETANILYMSLIEKFGGSNEAKLAQESIDPAVSNLENYILNIGEGIFKGDVNKFGINRNAALRYVDACEAYALVYPEGEKTASFLFRAAEIAKSIQTYPKVLSLYDWIIERYPNYEKTPTTYFLKGFVLENDLQNNDKAKEVYDAFIQKFPTHELRDDVEFLLEHLGKSDEEIRKIIESKQGTPES